MIRNRVLCENRYRLFIARQLLRTNIPATRQRRVVRRRQLRGIRFCSFFSSPRNYGTIINRKNENENRTTVTDCDGMIFIDTSVRVSRPQLPNNQSSLIVYNITGITLHRSKSINDWRNGRGKSRRLWFTNIRHEYFYAIVLPIFSARQSHGFGLGRRRKMPK